MGVSVRRFGSGCFSLDGRYVPFPHPVRELMRLVYHGSDVTLWMGQMSWEGHLHSPHRRDRSSELGSLLINFIVHLDPNDPVLLSCSYPSLEWKLY